MENPTLPTNWMAALSNARSASRWVTLVQQALGYAALLSKNLDGIQTTSIAGIGIGNGCGAVCNMAEQAFFT